ncbi:GntR family transcriptional regulator [Kocuria atrinae]|uniref:GntR family transcriptional regulator n=1 Tax=Kocuria atrinae TaxID=592377 RepID=UPI001CB8EFF0|nr:GntR family transcriptional regulator [Kocuria atrinae]
MTSNYAFEPASAAAHTSATAPSGTPTPLDTDGAQASGLAAAQLRARISGGQLAPGAKLSEQAIARELGISRNTLREAFTVLAGESLVDRVPTAECSWRVRPQTTSERSTVPVALSSRGLCCGARGRSMS